MCIHVVYLLPNDDEELKSDIDSTQSRGIR